MYEAKKFKSIHELDGISERTMTEHYKLYEGYVKKYNEITEKLKTVDLESANQTYSEIRSLKIDLTFAIGGVRNHELYFGHLGLPRAESRGGNGGEPSGELAKMVIRDFGSYGAWRQDFTATAMAARGWAWLAWDRELKKLFNFIGDTQNTYPVWDCAPLVALDVYEHAYYLDFGIKRADYIEAFFKNLDWLVVEDHFVRLGVK